MLNSKRALSKVLIVMTILVSSIIMLVGCGKKKNEEKKNEEYKTAIVNYFEGIKNKDVNSIYKAFPDFMKMDENITADDVTELYTQYESLYGANISINYELGDAIQVEEDEVKQIQEDLINVYEENAEKIEVTAGYIVPVKVTISGDGLPAAEGEEQVPASDTQESDMQVYLINGEWYLV